MLSLHLIAEAGAGAEPCSSCVEFGGGAVSNVRVNVLYVSSGIMGQSFQGYCHRKFGFTKIGSIASSNYEMKSPIVLTRFYRRLKPSIVHQAGKLGAPSDLTFSCTTYSNKDKTRQDRIHPQGRKTPNFLP